MDTKGFIDSLFDAYEESDALNDFKEELQSNLEARIKNNRAGGQSEEEAFYKAAAELEDISALADEISLKKKQEVFEDMYMDIRHYMKPGRVAAYVACGFCAAFGIVTALVAWFDSGLAESFFGVLIAFLTAAAAGFSFLALTQETAVREALPWKRAVLYAASVGVFIFGLLVAAVTWAAAGKLAALGSLIPFVLPSAAILIFLVLTEKDRRKPWVKAQIAAAVREANERFADPAQARRYGLLCGALWMFAFAVFALLSLTVGFKFSWITFLFTIALQCVIEYFTGKKTSDA